MSYIANFKVTNGSRTFNKGDELKGIPPKEMERLIELGAVSTVNIVQAAKVPSVETFDDKFIKMLGEQNKNELTNYAAALNITVDSKMNKQEILDAILKECDDSGYDFASLTEEQVNRLAELAEINVVGLDQDGKVAALVQVVESEDE